MPLRASQAYCNGRAKFTPGGELLECVWASRPLFRFRAVEPVRKEHKVPDVRAARGEGVSDRGARRAKKRLFELCMCNEFDTFITLTLDRRKIDRYDIKAVTKKLNVWLDNRVRRKGLRYVLVPELHKDGAIHFHGLVNSEALQLVDSGHKDKKGRDIFNVTDWKMGFTTAVKVDENYRRVCNYVSKYITKQYGGGGKGANQGPVGGRWFYHGGALKTPVVRYLDFDRMPDSGREFKVDEAGLTLVYMTDCQQGEVINDRLYSRGVAQRDTAVFEAGERAGNAHGDESRHEDWGPSVSALGWGLGGRAPGGKGKRGVRGGQDRQAPGHLSFAVGARPAEKAPGEGLPLAFPWEGFQKAQDKAGGLEGFARGS